MSRVIHWLLCSLLAWMSMLLSLELSCQSFESSLIKTHQFRMVLPSSFVNLIKIMIIIIIWRGERESQSAWLFAYFGFPSSSFSCQWNKEEWLTHILTAASQIKWAFEDSLLTAWNHLSMASLHTGRPIQISHRMGVRMGGCGDRQVKRPKLYGMSSGGSICLLCAWEGVKAKASLSQHLPWRKWVIWNVCFSNAPYDIIERFFPLPLPPLFPSSSSFASSFSLSLSRLHTQLSATN